MGLMGRDVVGRYDLSLFLLGHGQLVFWVLFFLCFLSEMGSLMHWVCDCHLALHLHLHKYMIEPIYWV